MLRPIATRLLSIGLTVALIFSSALTFAQMTPSPDQKIALITGATSGLGREVALRLSALNYFVIVHGRNEERGMEVVNEINTMDTGSARFYQADLGSLEQVRSFGEAVLNDYDHIDLLLNNAGIATSPEQRLISEDGHELRFQVNYLSHFLLTDILLPLVRASDDARIVNVASGAQQAIDFDDVMLENDFSGRRAYAQSKLAQILYTIDLAEMLEGDNIPVNTLHPATRMPTGMVLQSGGRVMDTIEEGADSVMNLITGDVGTGDYYNRQEVARANDQAYDEEARARLWQLSEELTGLD